MSSMNAQQPTYSASYRAWVLGLLSLIYMVNYIDRALLNIVGQAVKLDLGLSDFQLGLAGGAAFALVNGAIALPIARLAEHRSRVAIISASLAFWSLMTAVCGTAQNYWQLILARAGVGVGEAGGLAPSQSLIADYYPVQRRASALAIFGAAVPLGMLVGALGSGWITEHFSWRAAFIAMGIPGIAIAIVAALTLKEPPRGHSDGLVLQGSPPPLREVLRMLAAQPVFRHVLIGGSVLNFGFFGFLTFLHPFMVRSMHLAYGEAAIFYGLVTGIACGIGFLLGGLLADRLARRDRRW
jgi:MFS family permease